MNFEFKQAGYNDYYLLVPPANRPLIDGKTGLPMVFTLIDVNKAMVRSPYSSAYRIIEALMKLENMRHV